MIINNDKSNELNDTIISIAKNQIKEGNVIGIYLTSYIDKEKNNQAQIEITTVVDKCTPSWRKKINDSYNKWIYTKVRKIYVKTNIEVESGFDYVYMEWREARLAQELKNSVIVYDRNGILEEYKQIYDCDKSLPLYTNRIEISPKLVKRIRKGICSKEEVQIPNTMTTHHINPFVMGADGIIEQIKKILNRYYYETSEEYADYRDSYYICNDENLKRFKKNQSRMKENYYKYDEYYWFNGMKTDNNPDSSLSTMKRKEFYQQCLNYLESQLYFVSVRDYLDEEEVRIYDELNEDIKVKIKERK